MNNVMIKSISLLIFLVFAGCSTFYLSQTELKNALAQEKYQFFKTFEELPPRLSASFYAFTGIEKKNIANPGEPTNGGDVIIESLPNCGFTLAGTSQKYSFIVYSSGGLINDRTNIVIFKISDHSPVPVWSGYCLDQRTNFETPDSILNALSNIASRGNFTKQWSN